MVAFGGGLVGNIAGLVSALLFRGVRLVHIPTTLLAMSDSVLSLKQAVNGTHAKNAYGTYHIPSLICCDVRYLATLATEQISAGVVELYKNCLANRVDRLSTVRRLSRMLNEPAAWPEMLTLGIEAKQGILCDDPKEVNNGLLLEYGHTVGHALELESRTLPHGHAIGLGMLAAASIAHDRGWLQDSEVAEHVRALQLCQAPQVPPKGIELRSLLSRIARDNKRGRIRLCPDEHAFVLLRGLGKVATTDGLPLVPVKESEVLRALGQLGIG